MHITIGLVFKFQQNLSDRKEEPLERKSDIRVIQDNRFGRIDGSKLDYAGIGFDRRYNFHACALQDVHSRL
jgi:hypothetical protein